MAQYILFHCLCIILIKIVFYFNNYQEVDSDEVALVYLLAPLLILGVIIIWIKRTVKGE